MSIAGKAFGGFSLLVSLVGLGAESPVTALKIEVHLYNYSGATAEELARAEQETARIYGRLGVQMEWRNCPRTAEELAQNTTCDLPATPTRFTLGLLSNEMAKRFPVHDDIYGFALPSINGGFGMTANVFADRARDIGADEETYGAILGHLMAHELGHLLLEETRHPAGAGIMHVPWQTKELVRIKQGVMFFLPEQAKRIRAQVLARTISETEPGSKITVLFYNYAAVSPQVLAEMEAEAARIYQAAGIGIQWLDCPLLPRDADRFPACQVAPGPTKLALRILSQSMAERLRQAEDSFGFALIPEDGSFATVANVFSYDAEQLANRRGMRHGVILGHLAAHELGHLLLGAESHSSTGIMHVPWHLKELDIIAQGLMMFRAQETESMRTNIRARLERERPTEAALAPRN